MVRGAGAEIARRVEAKGARIGAGSYCRTRRHCTCLGVDGGLARWSERGAGGRHLAFCASVVTPHSESVRDASNGAIEARCGLAALARETKGYAAAAAAAAAAQVPRPPSRGAALQDELREALDSGRPRFAVRRIQGELSAWLADHPRPPARSSRPPRARGSGSPRRGGDSGVEGGSDGDGGVRTPSPVDERELFVRKCRELSVAAVPCLLTRRHEEVYNLNNYGAGDKIMQVHP